MSVFKSVEGLTAKNQALLHSAAKSGDTTLLQHLLEKGVSVHTQCPKGFTPLHYAVMSKNTTNIELLLKKGASIYFPDQQGKTALDLAVDNYSSANCELTPKSAILILLLSYTLLDEETTSTFTFLAVEKNDEELLKFFLKKDPATRIHSTFQDNRSLLHVAAESNHPGLIKVLLEHGADINAKTFSGETALHLAAAAGNVEVAKKLIYSGLAVDCIDNNGSIPLHYAIRNNRRSIILLLTNLPKSLINRLNSSSLNPTLLHYAVIKNDEEFFNLALKNSSVDLNAKTKDGETPLHFAIIYNRLKLIYELVKRGADVNAQSTNGETPLHFAAALGQAHSVEFLLRKAADVNSFTTSGSTPLHYALDRDRCNDIVGGYNRPLSLLDDLKPRYTIVKTLLNNQAVANFRDHSGKTPLHYAMAMNVNSKNNIKHRIDTIRCLVIHGADVNALCNKNCTPLFFGFDAMDEKLLWWLIRRGANVTNNHTNVDSFLSKAIKFKNLKMIDVLLEAGVKVTSRNIFEASFSNEIDKGNYFEILELLTNRTNDVKSVITKLSQFLDSEWQLKINDREDIMNKLSAILIRRELNGEIIIKQDDFELDKISERNVRNRLAICREQIFKMKKININQDGLTLYKVFMASINQLSHYVQNQDLKSYLHSDSFTLNFSHCWNLMQSRYKKARIKKILLDFSADSLLNLVNKAHKIQLPLSTSNQIVQYLSMVDLTHLMQFRCSQSPTTKIIIKN
ncbi:putative ankyrin repeat protein RF_0381 [Leptopilina boulardi]|uniref:putative ankyrin repeat protein RF_0381 n=1 Tax=Leptopilina boulardi TaxID=63433 RepID=UPI0021F5E4C3|nr:putative ankyrin repeat protein RF_0381 [Leptopilina boulardi]